MITCGHETRQHITLKCMTRDEVNAYHPEMYDENGIMLNEELLTVKFINEEDLDETADE
mgnify:CR=1 FL=1